jgi:ATP-binding cassette subfamily F protein 3
MALVALTDLSFDYGREKILDRISVAIQPGVKYALVGANGAGKTTLLAALAGELDLPAGTRQATGSLRIQRLRQETLLAAELAETGSVRDAVANAAFGEELALEDELARIAHQLAIESQSSDEHEELIRRQGKLQQEFEHRDGYTLRSRLEATLRGVGLGPQNWTRSLTELSGGERRRAALAAVLLGGADLLLLDEPTNHLDLDGCEWLEGFLGQFRGAILLVSHDRQFLDRLADRTLHLERGQLIAYSGNYSFFATARRQRFQLELSTWQRQQDRIRQAEEYIRRNIAGQKTRQAQSRRKQLAREVRLPRPRDEAAVPHFLLQPERPSGGTVLQVTGLQKRFSDQLLFTDLDLHVSRGDRIGIIGPNGCGKTTLLKILAGAELPDTGHVKRGQNVDLGLYDQELMSVADRNTVIGELGAVDPRATIGELRSFLAAFGFDSDLYDRPVGDLSGGQRSRLALLRLIMQGHNTLLLDEPTNHLDIGNRAALEAALAGYDGTLIVVSHDRRFLDALVQRLLVFPSLDRPQDAGRVQMFLGGYSDLVNRRAAEQASGVQAGAERPVRAAGRRRAAGDHDAAAMTDGDTDRVALSKNERARRLRWIAAVEDEIAECELRKSAALDEMSDQALGPSRRRELAELCDELESTLAQCMLRGEQGHRESDGPSDT